MLILKLLLVISGCGLLAMVAMVAYDIYLARELERLNRRARVMPSPGRASGHVAEERGGVGTVGPALRH